MKQMKIVVIGGGSSYTPELLQGIIDNYSTLPVNQLVLVDIKEGENKVKINARFLRRIIEKQGLPIEVEYTLNRREALKGADFIVTQLRVGGLAARALDEKIPLKYDVIGQETTGPGGFLKALRTIPVILDLCKDIEEVCPDAWLINFTNPAGIITEAVSNHTNVKVIGLCNVPINMKYEVAERLKVSPERINCTFVGLNHLSYINHIYLDGKDIIDEVLQVYSRTQSESVVKNISKIDDMDKFTGILGLIPSPYLQYFYFENKMLNEEKENMEKGIGTRAEQVMKVEKNLFEIYESEITEIPEELSKRGGSRYSEVAINLINSIWNNTGDLHVVNVMNKGSIVDLPYDCVIESNCIVNNQGATPISNGYLPENISGLVKQVKIYEQLTIEAAVKGDRNKALLALVNNPLVSNIDKAESILAELLEAHKKYLPRFY
ncbi:6-phospho-beta-glucosidase [Vallitalea longa]|uniref:6-phospho-beta-glucosidase n=1 Tax=Vallitalea longa TaxID=2936439 RepID=A0A9W5YE22_9FIRM|nr:6-phospho-beta-glucosidase [Vallitalea longa]GKX31797.1 6-phospho-beta-glucosidase [Vallitalea longa]